MEKSGKLKKIPDAFDEFEEDMEDAISEKDIERAMEAVRKKKKEREKLGLTGTSVKEHNKTKKPERGSDFTPEKLNEYRKTLKAQDPNISDKEIEDLIEMIEET